MQQILSFIPIIIFFITYKFGKSIAPNHEPIITATFFLVLTSTISILYSTIRNKKQDKLTFYSNIAIIFFGSLTVLFHNPSFIKIKITIINVIFSGILFYNYFNPNPPISKMFQGKIEMESKPWQILSLRLAIIFLAIAIGNEIIYRNFSEETWVKYKVFGVSTLTMVYFLAQIPFIMKHSKQLRNLS
jgi:intracellular septation protein